MLVVSAVDSSRRFWMRQGLHAMAHCEPQVASCLRALRKRGNLFGFFETTQMAMALPSGIQMGDLVAKAFARIRNRRPPSQGVSAASAAAEVGYEDLPSHASFYFDDEGKRQLMCDEETARQDALPPHKLQAFPKEGGGAGWGVGGWGVRSLQPVKKGQVVMEFAGEWLTDEQHANLSVPQRSLVVGLDERMRERKRRSETILFPPRPPFSPTPPHTHVASPCCPYIHQLDLIYMTPIPSFSDLLPSVFLNLDKT